jgi:hypothetical protein
MKEPLSDKVAAEIGGAYSRLEELRAKSILESPDANERRALEKFLSDTLVEHGVELLGSWYTVRNRYRPLVQGFVALIEAADSILHRARQAPQNSDPREK